MRMIKIEIDSETVDTNEGVKEGKAWKMASQVCYIFLYEGSKYPIKTKVQIPIKDGVMSAPLRSGFYEISEDELTKTNQFEELITKVKYNKLKSLKADTLKSVATK